MSGDYRNVEYIGLFGPLKVTEELFFSEKCLMV